MKKEIKHEQNIEVNGNNKVVVRKIENSNTNDEQSIEVKGDNNIVIQNSSNSSITIGGKEY